MRRDVEAGRGRGVALGVVTAVTARTGEGRVGVEGVLTDAKMLRKSRAPSGSDSSAELAPDIWKTPSAPSEGARL
jgi:hypothetical protein